MAMLTAKNKHYPNLPLEFLREIRAIFFILRNYTRSLENTITLEVQERQYCDMGGRGSLSF